MDEIVGMISQAPVRKWVVNIRRGNPCAKLYQIAQRVGVTKERVRQILYDEGLPTSAVILRIACMVCGKRTRNKKFCSHECQLEYHLIPLTCEVCGRVFKRKKAWIMASYRYTPNADGSPHIFCDKHCHGKWLYQFRRKKNENQRS